MRDSGLVHRTLFHYRQNMRLYLEGNAMGYDFSRALAKISHGNLKGQTKSSFFYRKREGLIDHGRVARQ